MINKRVQRTYMAFAACAIWGLSGISLAVGTEVGRALWLVRLLAALFALPFYFWLPQCFAKPARCTWWRTVYPLLLSAFLLTALVRFWCVWLSSATAPYPFIFMMAGLLAYCAYLGRRAIGRLAVLCTILLAIISVVDTAALASSMSFERLCLRPGQQLLPPLVSAIGLFLLYLLPLPLLVPEEERDLRSACCGIKKGYLLAAGYTLLSGLREALLLGDLLSVDTYPLLRSLRMMNLGIGLTHIEYFGVLVLLSAATCGLALPAITLHDVLPWPKKDGLRAILTGILVGVFAAGLTFLLF